MLKKSMVMMLAAAFLLIGTTGTVFSYIHSNGSGGVYDDGGTVDTTGTAIESYVIEGAGYYLDANSGVQALLYTVETQELYGTAADADLLDNIDFALENIGLAAKTYEHLIATAEATPYKDDEIRKLEDFDYTTYMIEKELNPAVFAGVEFFLKQGDVTGLYKKTYAGFNRLYEQLAGIRETVVQGNEPDISEYWELNEKLSETALFGSYVARVFAALP